MAYTFSVNATPATGNLAMWQLVAALIAAGWTKVSDSDGTTYSSGGTQVTGGNTGANGLGNTSAWVHLRAPAVSGQQRSLTIQRGTSSTVWRIKYSAAATFVGGSPAAAVTPSATDESIIIGAGTDASPTYTAVFGADAAYRWHVAAGGSAELYSFVALAMVNTTTTTSRVIFLDVIRVGTQLVSDVDPCIVGTNATGSTCLSEIQNITTSGTNPRMSDSWLGPTSSIANHVRCSILTPTSMTPNSGGLVPGQNPFTSTDVGFPVLWGRVVGATAPTGLKGYSTLFRHNSNQRTNMDTLNVSGTRDFVYVNGYQLPWDGSVPTI